MGLYPEIMRLIYLTSKLRIKLYKYIPGFIKVYTRVYNTREGYKIIHVYLNTIFLLLSLSLWLCFPLISFRGLKSLRQNTPPNISPPEYKPPKKGLRTNISPGLIFGGLRYTVLGVADGPFLGFWVLTGKKISQNDQIRVSEGLKSRYLQL